MKITVVTVCYNAATFLEQTILSVLNQTYSDIEYVVIDGGSEDGTVDIIKKYIEKIDYYVSESDNGIYDAMNKGIDASTGDWIIFMNAGDVFVNDDVVAKIASYPNLEMTDVIFGDTIMTFPWGPMYIKSSITTGKNVNFGFCHQSVFAKTVLMKKYHFDTSYRVAADFNFFYDVLKEGGCFEHINIPVAVYDITGVSSVGRVKVYKEICHIKQCDHGLKYHMGLLWLRFKLFVKNILPSKIVSLYFSKKFNS